MVEPFWLKHEVCKHHDVSLDLWIRKQGTNTVHVFSSEFEAGLYQTFIMIKKESVEFY